MKNWNSSRNQEIKGQFVEREVMACASQLIYELKDSEGFQDNIWQEFYSTPDLEPYNFWIVSPWLGRKLKEYGEIVSFDFFGFTIWGRCSSGQAILLDGVISRICEELEMLED